MPSSVASSAGVGERPEPLLEHRGGGPETDMEILRPPRHVDSPRRVAEVAADLAEHRGHREAGEGGTGLGIEAVDRLHQTHEGDLLQVGERLTAVCEPPRAVPGEPDVLGYQLVAELRVARAAVLPEAIAHGLGVTRHRAPGRSDRQA